MQAHADTPRSRHLALLAFCVATVLLIPLHQHVAGAVAWLACAGLLWRDPLPAARRRIGVLLACIAILAVADIDTNLQPASVVPLVAAFAAVVLLPALVLGRSDPGVIRYRFWPSRLRKLDLFYVAISVPLAWGILKWYFQFEGDLHLNWSLPPEPDKGSVRALFWGINGTGVWDELFFVNTVYAVLRSLFSFRVANLAQAVVYTGVLYDMAFTGIGPLLVYGFALTQGSMFEESENLLWVLVVHLIVDYFLFWEIIHGHYPGGVPGGWVLH